MYWSLPKFQKFKKHKVINESPYRKWLFTGIVPANKNYVTGTVHANTNYVTGTVPANKPVQHRS